MGHDIRIHCEYYRLMISWLGNFGQTLYNAANVMAVVRLAKSIQLALLAHTINMVVHSSKLIKPNYLKVKAIVEYSLQSTLVA